MFSHFRFPLSFPRLSWFAALAALPLTVTAVPVGTTSTATSSPALNPHIGVTTHFVRKMKAFQHWDPDVYIPLIADLGAGWVRDEIVWAWMEKSRGNYEIPAKDRKWLDLAERHGIKVILTLSASNGKLYEDPYDPDAYAKAAAFLATELKGKLHAIEVLNEPYHWYAKAYGEGTTLGGDLYGRDKNGEEESWLKRYVVLLNKTAEAVKAANPDMKVIGLGGFPAMNMRMITMGLSSQVDGITLHPYSYRITPEIVPYATSEENFKRNGGRQTADTEGTFASLIRYSREFSAKHNGPKETWLTEWGWSTKRDAVDTRSNFSGFTEEAQAAYTLRRFMEGQGLGVEVSTMYSLLDNRNSWRTPERSEFFSDDNFGLLRDDGTPKPAFAAVRRLARETIGLTPGGKLRYTLTATTKRPDHQVFAARDGTRLRAPDRVISYQFTDAAGRPVIAFWSMERISDQSPRSADLEIDVSLEEIHAEAFDLLTGRIYEPVATEKEGKLFFKDIAVPPHPVLLRLLPR
ncbi:hypothetical protein OpiT1DRAFT_02967 [Opitutaceae bacterium TAV1]|nr:hypothetical protein OpiT1DRAFT_02967 [Opitutaceae bacterium TAV1]